MTSKQLKTLKEELLKQENEIYKLISILRRDSSDLYRVPIEMERANKIAENLRRIRLALPKPKEKGKTKTQDVATNLQYEKESDNRDYSN